MSKLNSFLKACKTFVSEAHSNQSTYSKLSLCIGNQASDLDSMISSIAYSYAISNKQKDCLVLPVMNIPEEDFNLRTDASWFLGKFGISSKNLVFYFDNKPLHELIEKFKERQALSIILTDHNKLAPEQDQLLSNFVTEIIDHHVDENHYKDGSLSLKLIELIGSTCTLISSQLSDEFLSEEKEISELLLGTILLDTMNLDPKFKKVTPKDEEQAKRLINILNYSKEQQDNLFNALFTERFDVSNLNSYDLLRSDYKDWKMGNTMVGISTAKRSLEDWYEKDQNLIQSFEHFYQNKSLDILYIMFAYSDKENNFKRQLGVYTKQKELFEKSIEYLEQQCKEELNLTPITTTTTVTTTLLKEKKKEDEYLTFYQQHNIASSRKVLQPLLTKFH
ncbi:hypothetical protein ABK040_002001 [Willaertia magna]